MKTVQIAQKPFLAPATFAGRPFPALILKAGPAATERFVEFFTVRIRNPNTRAAYAQAVGQFCMWAEQQGLSLSALRPVTLASYIEALGQTLAAPTVKQHLAALRMLFDWLVLSQVIPTNPAASVRGPKHVVKRGKTPILSATETRTLLDSLPTDRLVGLRDRALIAIMTYGFARVSAVTKMKVSDYYHTGKRGWIRLLEKGGRIHELPTHHNLQLYLDEYIAAAGVAAEPQSPLFRSVAGRAEKLNSAGLGRSDVFRMIKRRVAQAGVRPTTCCHSFRATGITTYLANGGKLERAQAMANHESAETTRIYDRREDQITLDEVERVVI